MNGWRFEEAIGPVSTGFGGKSWSLLFGPEVIVAYPYSGWENWKLAFYLRMGFPPDPGELTRHNAVLGRLTEKELLNPECRKFHISGIREIVMRGHHGGNQVHIVRVGGETVEYSLPVREKTAQFREVLRRMYPSLYKESGFESPLSPGRWI